MFNWKQVYNFQYVINFDMLKYNCDMTLLNASN